MVKELEAHVSSKCQQGAFQNSIVAAHSGTGCFYVHVVSWEKIRMNSFYWFSTGEQQFFSTQLRQVSKSEFAKFVQQLNMQQSGQTDSTYNIQQYWSSLWPTMLRQFARGFRGYEEDVTDSETNFISQHLNDDKIVRWFLQARIALRLEKVDPNVEVSIHAHPCHPLQHRDEFQCLLTQS